MYRNDTGAQALNPMAEKEQARAWAAAQSQANAVGMQVGRPYLDATPPGSYPTAAYANETQDCGNQVAPEGIIRGATSATHHARESVAEIAMRLEHIADSKFGTEPECEGRTAPDPIASGEVYELVNAQAALMGQISRIHRVLNRLERI
jgi:hypothetical protein